VIRLARPGDEVALAALADALNREDGEPLGFITAETIRRDFLSADPAGFALVAEGPGGAIIGYATVLPGYDPTRALRGSYMGDLFVVPEERRRGAARALVQAVAAETKRRGGVMVLWTSKPGNDGAAAFYAGLGAGSEPLTGWLLDGDAFAEAAGDSA
jgi:GNAT superfamily N-acetyltransferase